jgi:gliding motility-associated-like protein
MIKRENRIIIKSLLAGLLLILTMYQLHAQNQAANWYFGQNAGLNFMSGSPTPILTGALNTMEGCSSISTSDGSLRFYTDGIHVWDRHDNLMPNGTGLMGDPSSTQSGIIVPKPGSNNIFYIFTVDEVQTTPVGGANGLRYSVVDMNLNSFLGDVVSGEKNILLTAPLCEKVTAVGHANGTDIWVIAQKWGTNNFYSYLVTTNGVNTTPVISSAGAVIQGDVDNAKGYLKVSPDGKTIAKANAGLKSVEIFGFNTTTGEVSNQNVITDNGLGGEPYGIEFSPNSELLYVNTWKSNPGKILYQYNLKAPDVVGSRVQISSGTEGALQLAPDNRIYVAQNQNSYLSVINEPNNIGSACLFNYLSVSLGGKVSRWGLPPFIQSFFSFNPGYYFENTCFGDSTQFHENSSSEPDSLIWDFGDAASGNNSSTEPDPKHLFSKKGLFFVNLTVWIDGVEGSVTHLVNISEKPTVDLGPDTTFCSGDTLILDAGTDAEAYLWHNGDTSNIFPADTTGIYWVKATNKSCDVFDSIDITVLPSYFLQIDTAFCAGDSIYAGGKYQKTSGTYYDSLDNYIGCDSVIKTVLVVHDTFLIQKELGVCHGDSAFLGGSWQKESGVYYDYYNTWWGCDSTIQTSLTVYDKIETLQTVGICEGDSMFVGGDWQTQSGTFYDTLQSVWSCDSVVITDLTVSDVIHTETETDICEGDSLFAGGDWQTVEGVYIDSAQSVGGCDSVHTTNLFVNDVYDITWDTLICEGDSVYCGGDYQKSPGTYYDYLLTIKGCDSTIETLLSVTLLPVVDLGNDTSIMDGETLTLNAGGTPDATYLWQDGSTDSVYIVSDSGTYSVTVTNLCGFKNDSIKVTIYFPPEDLECYVMAPNAFTPNGDEHNDLFRPILQCPAESYTLRIFNRWGKMIYETNEPSTGWDGTVNGKPVERGTYAWTVYYKYTGVLHPGERTVKGLVTLVR